MVNEAIESHKVKWMAALELFVAQSMYDVSVNF